jgi:hypothetical protein
VSEVQRIPVINHGASVRIVRGTMAGWTVMVGGDAGFIGQTAHFSESGDLLKWLTAAFETSAHIMPPENGLIGQ